MADKYVRISGITIGDDSASGLAFRIETDSYEVFWVPYSVCRKRTVSYNKLNDSVEVEAWWAEKNEILGEPIS